MHKRLMAIPIVLILVFSFLSPAARMEGAMASAPLIGGMVQNGMVRVRLLSLGSPKTLTLRIDGSYSVNGDIDFSLPRNTKATVSFQASNGQWTLQYGGESYPMTASFRLCRHESAGENGIRILQSKESGNLYPGDLQFIAHKSGSGYEPYIILHVFMEDYLYGVLPYEMGNSSGLEALKAQAVAARTYTLKAMQDNASALYDVVDTTKDQVYAGTPSLGNGNCVQAVDATAGIAAMHGTQFTGTYYTASNGGQTESIQNAWGVQGYPYLKVKDDPFDFANPDSKTASYTITAVQKSSSGMLSLLNQKAQSQFGAGANVTAILDILPNTPKYPSPSRLYTKLAFQVEYTLNQSTYTGLLSFDIFNELESRFNLNISSGNCELWTVNQTASGFTVTARRYGHGVGMSQRGAMYMAKLGYTYDQILAFYYEGCQRVRFSLVRSVRSPIVRGQKGETQYIPMEPAPEENSSLPQTPETPQSAFTARVATKEGSLNLRKEPRANAKVLLTIPQGTVIPILNRGSDWCQTQYEGKTGYVMTSFLAFQGEETQEQSNVIESPPAASVPAWVNTKSGSLNLRKSDQSDAKVLLTIPQYASLLVLKKGDTWCRVEYNGTTGYVMTRYLSFEGASPESAAFPVPEESGQNTGLRRLSTPVLAQIVCPSSSLNLRAGASLSAPILVEMPKGDYLTILSLDDTWCQVEYRGLSGYCVKEYLEFALYEE